MANSGTSRGLKRKNAISWDEYFMGVACLSAHRSKDPNTQVGACVINKEKRIVGVGYNGMPDGLKDDEMHWGRNVKKPLENKKLYVCHAEMNAILNSFDASLRGCTIYTTLFPCNECAKMIIQSGITKVVYLGDKQSESIPTKAAKLLFDKKNENEDGNIEIVECELHEDVERQKRYKVRPKIVINFDSMAEAGKVNEESEPEE